MFNPTESFKRKLLYHGLKSFKTSKENDKEIVCDSMVFEFKTASVKITFFQNKESVSECIINTNFTPGEILKLSGIKILQTLEFD
jgi:hypothetical protein